MDEDTYVRSISILFKCIASIHADCSPKEFPKHVGRIWLNNARAYLYEQQFGKPAAYGARESLPRIKGRETNPIRMWVRRDRAENEALAFKAIRGLMQWRTQEGRPEC